MLNPISKFKKYFLSLLLTFLIFTNNIVLKNENENNENSYTSPKIANASDVNINKPPDLGEWKECSNYTNSRALMIVVTINNNSYDVKTYNINTAFTTSSDHQISSENAMLDSKGVKLKGYNTAILITNNGAEKNAIPFQLALENLTYNIGSQIKTHIAINPNCNVAVKVNTDVYLSCQSGSSGANGRSIYTTTNKPAIFVHPDSELTLFSNLAKVQPLVESQHQILPLKRFFFIYQKQQTRIHLLRILGAIPQEQLLF